MRIVWALALLLLLTATAALAATVGIAWDPNPPEEAVTGYTVYWGATSRFAQGWVSYESAQDVPVGTQTVVTIPDGAVRNFAVVAYNAAGLRSDYSAEVSNTVGQRYLFLGRIQGSFR